MIRAERTEYSNGILKTRVSPILTHCNSYSQIPQERPKSFPKSCFWDVFVTLWALFLTGPPLKMFFFTDPSPLSESNSALRTQNRILTLRFL